MVVVCPDGCGPGDAIVVTSHGGVELEVLIPDGVGEGDEFEVSFPPPAEGAADSSDGESF